MGSAELARLRFLPPAGHEQRDPLACRDECIPCMAVLVLSRCADCLIEEMPVGLSLRRTPTPQVSTISLWTPRDK